MAHPLLSVVAGLALLQAPPAAVVGDIRDGDTGAPIPGAVVALSDLSRVTTADAAGRYVLADAPPGPQHITVRFLGYEPRVLHALVPREGVLRINVSLRAAPLRLEPIVVHPPPALHGVEDPAAPFPDRSASAAAIRNHPLSAEPDAFQALGGGEVVLSPESPSGVHVRGGGSDQTGYELDGVPILSPYHAAGIFSAWNPDALAGLSLSAAAPSPGATGALSGTIAGETRPAGDRLRTQGSLSTTQGRLTLDGPLGNRGAGWLASARTGFPSGLAPADDPSYLRGHTADWLVTLRAPALGGGLRLLLYDNGNELDAAARAGAELPDATPRNRFEWHGRSVGGEWRREWPGAAIRVRGWSATLESEAAWAAIAGPLALASSRRDIGVLAAVERRSGSGGTEAGVRLERIGTTYQVTPTSAGPGWGLEGTTPVGAVFARHTRALGPVVRLELAGTAATAAGHPFLDPSVRIRWRLSSRLTATADVLRRHQYAQSLRNPESVVGNVFPPDLSVGSGAGGPVARSDQSVLALEVRPSPGVRLGAEAWARTFDGLLLVAPMAAEPFATGGFVVAGGRAHGFSLDVSMSAARYAFVAGYGFQWERLGRRPGEYVPEFATAHLLETGVLFFPTATSSIRLGVTAGAGRRATTSSGAIEWESCNLLDKGCELGGSPHYDGAALGGTRLPPYLRVDLGLRQHWHLRMGGHDAVVAVFGTMTNLFGRINLLSYSRDPLTGVSAAVEMRPLAPLVVGLDWQY